MKNSFRKTVDEWIDESDGDEEKLAEKIVEWIETASPRDIDDMASFVASELLADM